jgi:hypothetical protein
MECGLIELARGAIDAQKVNNSPQHDAGVVAGGAVVPSPSESLLVELQHFGDGEHREGQAAVQRRPVAVLHLARRRPHEPLVEVDVRAVERRRAQGDVDVVQTHVGAQ